MLRPIQGSLFGDLTERGACERVCVYAGYSFGMVRRALEMRIAHLLTGLVVTPRWLEALARDFCLDVSGLPPQTDWDHRIETWALDPRFEREGAPALSERVILDNGAFPAWRKGAPFGLSEQLEGLHAALCRLPLVEWIIAPDVVADGEASWHRTLASIPELECYGTDRLLLALQEGMCIKEVAGVARELDAGIFVGGATSRFKLEAVRALEHSGVRWVHVGRVSSQAMFEALASSCADAVDTTSLLRAQNHNLRMEKNYRHWLEEFAHERAMPDRDGHAPSPVGHR